jgi:hypothetical protein
MSDPRRWLDPSGEATDAVRDLLQRAPSPPAMSAEAKARIASKIATAGALPPVASRWKLLFGTGVVVGLATIAFVWHATLRDRRATGSPRVVAATPLASPEAARGPIQARDSTSPPVAASEGPLEGAHVRAPAATAARTPRAIAPRHDESSAMHSASTGVADELELLQRASALVERDPHGALAVAHEHETLYPRGEYVEERESIAVRALANAGERRAARDRATRFLRRYPTSIYATRVRGILETLR